MILEGHYMTNNGYDRRPSNNSSAASPPAAAYILSIGPAQRSIFHTFQYFVYPSVYFLSKKSTLVMR